MIRNMDTSAEPSCARSSAAVRHVSQNATVGSDSGLIDRRPRAATVARRRRGESVLNRHHRRIAIIGSANRARNSPTVKWPYDPELRNSEDSVRACEAIGRALAEAGWDIVVYSGEGLYEHEGFIEPSVVTGFLSKGKGRAHSVHVHYASGYERPKFREQQSTTHHQAFRYTRDPSDEWEPSFYRSLADVDAALVLGGGHSAYLAGLVCIGRRIPILALNTFGAGGALVYDAIVKAHVPLLDSDLDLLGQDTWSDGSAVDLVASLATQQQALDKEREEFLAQIRRRRRSQSASVALFLFVAAAVLVPTALVVERADSWFEYALLFFAPVVAGASGGTIRSLLPKTDSTEISTLQSALLGAVAGGIAGLVYIVSQLTSTPDTDLGRLTERQYQTWVLFGVVIGFASGLALDAVFQRLVAAGAAHPREIGRNRSG